MLPLGLTAKGKATDATIQKKIYVSGVTTMIVSNEEMGGTTKIIKSLKQSYLFPKGAIKTIENKEKKIDGFLNMLFRKLDTSLLGNLLVGKAKIPRQGLIRAGEETIRAGQNF